MIIKKMIHDKKDDNHKDDHWKDDHDKKITIAKITKKDNNYDLLHVPFLLSGGAKSAPHSSTLSITLTMNSKMYYSHGDQ